MKERRPPYEIMKDQEKRGIGHFNEEGEWVHDHCIDPKTKKVVIKEKKDK